MTTTVSKKAKKGRKKRGGKENLLKNEIAFKGLPFDMWIIIGTDIELIFNENLKIEILPDSNA